MDSDQPYFPHGHNDLPAVTETGRSDDFQASLPAPKIEGHEILGMIGQAGQGQVWKAVQLSTHRTVALKVPRFHGFGSQKTFLRFEREVQIAARLKHPNIAQIYDSGVHKGIYFYTMELIDGQHLDVYVKDNNLSQTEILNIFRKICLAIQYAHQNAVIHRDLKPSNIIVSQDGEPHVVDFGLAKGLREDDAALTVTQDSDAAGTPAFMSPEQAVGKADKIDTRSDIYSLGAILYYLLTGMCPHELKGNRYDVLKTIAEKEIRHPRECCSKINKELGYVLLKAMAKDPDRRYASVGEFASDIANYLVGKPLIAGPESTAYKVKKFIKRRKGLVAAVVSVLATLATGIIIISSLYISSEQLRLNERAATTELRQSRDMSRRLAYRNKIQLISSRIELGDTDLLRNHLFDTAPSLRNWEWGWLANWCNFPEQSLNVFNGSVTLLSKIPNHEKVLAGDDKGKLVLWDLVKDQIQWQQRFPEAFEGHASVDMHAKKIYLLNSSILHVCSFENGNTIYRIDDYDFITMCPEIENSTLYLGTGKGELLMFDGKSSNISLMVKKDGPIKHIARDNKNQQLAFYASPYIYIYDTNTWQKIHSYRRKMAEGPRGMRFMGSRNELVVIEHNAAYLYSIDKKNARRLAGHGQRCFALDISRDEKYLVTSSINGSIYVYETESWEIIKKMSQPGGVFHVIFGDNNEIYSANTYGDVEVWTIDDYRQKNLYAAIKDPESRRTGAYSLKYRGDAGMLAIRYWADGNNVILYDVTQRESNVVSLTDHRQIPDGERSRFYDFRPGTSQLAVDDEGYLKFYETNAEHNPLQFKLPHEGHLHDAAFTADGAELAVSYLDGPIHLYNLDSNKKRPVQFDGQQNNALRLIVLKDSTQLLGFDDKFGVLYLWHLFSGDLLSKFELDPFDSVCFGNGYALHPDNTIFAYQVNAESDIAIWDIQEQQTVNILKGHSFSTERISLNFSPDGERLISGSTDQTLRIWDWVLGKELLVITQPWYVICAQFSPCNRSIATTDLGYPIMGRIYQAVPWTPKNLPGKPGAALEARINLWQRQLSISAFPR